MGLKLNQLETPSEHSSASGDKPCGAARFPGVDALFVADLLQIDSEAMSCWQAQFPREKERPGIDGYVEASNATEALTCGVYHLRDLLRNACFQ